jgi:hypothetical protein
MDFGHEILPGTGLLSVVVVATVTSLGFCFFFIFNQRQTVKYNTTDSLLLPEVVTY